MGEGALLKMSSRHNIIHIHNSVMWTDNILYNIFRIWIECGNIPCNAISLYNIVMDLNNVMEIGGAKFFVYECTFHLSDK